MSSETKRDQIKEEKMHYKFVIRNYQMRWREKMPIMKKKDKNKDKNMEE
jgi:hypothetical protein